MTKLMLGGLALGGLLAGCTLLGPPQTDTVERPGSQAPQERLAPGAYAPGQTGAAPAAQPAPFEGTPAQPPPAPTERRFILGPAAAALVSEAHSQEQSRNFGLAAQTLERALSIEPHNPLVWIELGRENILAGNPSQAYGMGRKALYMASGDPRAQAHAWQLIAASLRAQGRNEEAYVAEEKAVALTQN